MHMTWHLDPTIFVRILLASFLGCLIGLEREIHGRPAGFRTHLLVSLGSCLYVICSIDFYRAYGNFSGTVPVGVDPARVAAQVVTGIGFLGAGAIIRDRASIRGLTTAACLWVAAAIGLSCGIGLFGAATAVTALSLLSLLLLKRVEMRLRRDIYVNIRVWSDDLPRQREVVEKIIADCCLDLINMTVEKDLDKGEAAFDFHLKCRNKSSSTELVDKIAAVGGIRKIRLD